MKKDLYGITGIKFFSKDCKKKNVRKVLIPKLKAMVEKNAKFFEEIVFGFNEYYRMYSVALLLESKVVEFQYQITMLQLKRKVLTGVLGGDGSGSVEFNDVVSTNKIIDDMTASRDAISSNSDYEFDMKFVLPQGISINGGGRIGRGKPANVKQWYVKYVNALIGALRED